jgi:hypothetical protein
VTDEPLIFFSTLNPPDEQTPALELRQDGATPYHRRKREALAVGQEAGAMIQWATALLATTAPPLRAALLTLDQHIIARFTHTRLPMRLPDALTKCQSSSVQGSLVCACNKPRLCLTFLLSRVTLSTTSQ